MTTDIVNNLETGGTTNIFGAIKFAIKQVNQRTDCTRNPHIFFFTDGQANRSPRNGEI